MRVCGTPGALRRPWWKVGRIPNLPVSIKIVRGTASICEVFTVQISIDSTEPLDKVLKVIGALYGVTLGEATEGLVDRGSQGAKPRAARTNKKRSGVTSRSPKKTSRSTRSTRSARRPSKAAPEAASVRTWAKANGHPVRDRGRVPASVTAAYLAAGEPDA